MSHLWIGAIGEMNLIYDREIQLDGCVHVFLWDCKSEKINKYDPKITRKQIRPRKDTTSFEKEINVYITWKTKYGDLWVKQQEQYYYDRKKKEVAEREIKSLIKEEKDKEAAQLHLDLEYRKNEDYQEDLRHARRANLFYEVSEECYLPEDVGRIISEWDEIFDKSR